MLRDFVVFCSSLYYINCLAFSNDEILRIQNTTSILDENLQRFGDNILGISTLENVYRKEAQLKSRSFNASENLNGIVNRVGERLDKAVDVLRRSKDFIEHSKERNKKSNSLQQCCAVDDTKNVFDSRFSKQVIPDTCCLNCHMNFLGNESSEFFRSNLESTPSLLWQYNGDTDGRYFQYPASSQKMCNGNVSLDIRFQ